MTMTTLTKTVVFWIALAGGPWACSDDDGPAADLGAQPPDLGTLSDSGTEADLPDPASDAGPAADATLFPHFCGVLEDPAGQPVADGIVTVCTEHDCHQTNAGPTGAFCVVVKDPGSYMLHVPDQTKGGTYYADVVFPIELTAAEAEAGTRVELGSIIAHPTGPRVTLDPAAGGTVDLGDGVILSVPPAVTQKPPLMSSVDLGVALVETSQIHPRLLASYSGAGTLAAALAVVPLEVTFTAPISVTAPAPSGIAEGTALEIVRANPLTGALEPDGAASVTSGTITSTPGAGPTGLGWLLFFTP